MRDLREGGGNQKAKTRRKKKSSNECSSSVRNLKRCKGKGGGGGAWILISEVGKIKREKRKPVVMRSDAGFAKRLLARVDNKRKIGQA